MKKAEVWFGRRWKRRERGWGLRWAVVKWMQENSSPPEAPCPVWLGSFRPKLSETRDVKPPATRRRRAPRSNRVPPQSPTEPHVQTNALNNEKTANRTPTDTCDVLPRLPTVPDSAMDDSDVFSSPTRSGPAAGQQSGQPANQNARFDAEEAREAALRRELEGVRKINEAVEGVIGTLERARGNMGVRPPTPPRRPRTKADRARYRTCPRRWPTPPRCSTRGRASCRRRSTTSGC